MTMELGNLFFGNSRGEVAIKRSRGWEEMLVELFEACGDGDNHGIDFENDVFRVFPYYYKPTDYRVSWYKYPLRDSYANRMVKTTEFRKMIEHCIESVRR